ncbi:MAG: hypothetical protein U0166_21525 [Acidobacteriota bacterium]
MWSAVASAQFQQYAPPGSLAELPEDRHARLERALHDAPHDVGKVRIQPWYALRDLGVAVNPGRDQGASSSDLHARIGAGLEGYLPVGRHTVAAAYARPEYAWWNTLSSERRLIGRYGAGALSRHSHVSIEAFVTRDDLQLASTADVRHDASTRLDTGGLALEVRPWGRLSFFGGAYVRRTTDLEGDPTGTPPALSTLDRTEDLLRAGIRYRLRSDLVVGLGAESTRAVFEHAACGCDNSGIAPLFELRYDRSPLRFDASLARRDQRPDGAATFAPYQTIDGTVRVGLAPGGRFSYALYGLRGFSYTQDAGYSYLRSDRIGASWSARVGWRVWPRVFAETGRNDYAGRTPGAATRRDLVTSYGVEARVEVWRRSSVVLRATRTRYDSNLPSSDRSAGALTLDLQLGGGGGFSW